MIIAGERSGVGKTTVTLALLSCLSRRNLQVQSFKVGPDYIDPMFHRYVTGRPCRNLDPVLTSEAYVQQCFQKHTQDVTHAIVEGVMGLFDGAADRQDFGSTAHVARLLNLPILLVLDCSRLSHSIAALLHGYRSFDPRLTIAGVVLNRVGSDRHLGMLEGAIAPSNVPILGVLRREDRISLPDRHLGLIPTDELKDLDAVIDRLADLGETCFDWSRLEPLVARWGAKGMQNRTHQSNESDPLEFSMTSLKKEETQSLLKFPPLKEDLGESRVCCEDRSIGLKTQPPHNSQSTVHHPKIAIAQDAAFSFYYADNLDILRELGAELIPWSPLSDAALPQGVQGMYFGGGFPEMFAAQLAENEAARKAVRQAIAEGMPTYAECGGLMYLCETLTDLEGRTFPMVGALPTSTVMGSRLVLGYRQAIALQDSPLLTQGQTVSGHEFHRSHLTTLPLNPLYQFLPSTEGYSLSNLHASYLHLHWGASRDIPARFLQHLHSSPILKEGESDRSLPPSEPS
ncbi:MAG TPA: cobyrinate a,c-diamide synthase [Thermosynechococcaceae cyanobacterium]